MKINLAKLKSFDFVVIVLAIFGGVVALLSLLSTAGVGHLVFTYTA